MDGTFGVYARLGVQHITDLQGYDHLLFLAALAAAWPASAWRRLALLTTAFTVGHSLTLALATLGHLVVDAAWVEFLIPVTIAATAALALRGADPSARPLGPTYALVTGFGLVHGLGFSGFLRAALGEEESLALPLVAFNVGLELGQLAIVAAVVALGALATGPLRLPRRTWTVTTAICILLAALALAADRWPGRAA